MPEPTIPADGLVFARILDGKGGARQVDWEGIHAWQPGDGVLWVHLHQRDPVAQAWLEEGAGLDPLASEALLAEESRPRSATVGEGLLLNLRAVNLNPGEDPEDMVSLRIWIEPDRAITVRRRPAMAVQDVRVDLGTGQGPLNAGDLVVALAASVTERIAGTVSDIDDTVDALEEEVLETADSGLRSRIGAVRRQIISLRRYLVSQREVMNRLPNERLPWLEDRDRMHLREVSDRTTRYVEDLDAARDRAGVVHEELTSRLSEQMNRTMYLLAIISVIFLPLSLLTGLLGINVGGIPGSESPNGFLIVCVAMLALAVGLYAIFHRKRML